MYHNISLSSLVTVKGRIPFPAWVRVKIIMYPFTFPIKEYGDEVESQQGVPDTQAQSQNVFALLCCHNQDTLNYHRFRLEAVSVFSPQTLLANEKLRRSEWTKQHPNDCLYSGNMKQFWLIIGTMSANDAIVSVQAKAGEKKKKKKERGWLRTKQRQLNPSSFIHYINDILTRENSSLLLHYTVLDLCLADW